MAIEILGEVTKAEEKAAQLKRDATQAKDRAKEDALTSAKRKKTDAIEKIASTNEEILKQTIATAEKGLEESNVKTSAECERIKDSARANMKKAVDIIVAKVVSANG